MAFIDVVEWSPSSNDIYAWRFPQSNLSTATQLIVRESQEAVFFSKGQILGKFGPGKHELSTENIPLLRNLYGIPFGGRNPFYAEVWFVNRTMPLTIDWRTTPMRVMDPEYGAMVPLVAQGRYGVQVQDSEKFLVKLIGTMESFTATNLTDHFMGPLIAKTNSAIVSYMNANRVGITQIAGYLEQLGAFIAQPMSEFWDEFGLRLTGFYVTSIDIDKSSPEGRKISEAISDRSAQNIAGYTWQQRQSFDVANNAMSSNSGMGLLGVAMMGGMFSQGGGMGQSVM
ncbi:MAG: SPFH domain-containing protein, partial [Coriobacteriales bacterium]|nr:SPFH domain-containing protein [Coriobacteriales bacterium]